MTRASSDRGGCVAEDSGTTFQTVLVLKFALQPPNHDATHTLRHMRGDAPYSVTVFTSHLACERFLIAYLRAAARVLADGHAGVLLPPRRCSRRPASLAHCDDTICTAASATHGMRFDAGRLLDASNCVQSQRHWLPSARIDC